MVQKENDVISEFYNQVNSSKKNQKNKLEISRKQSPFLTDLQKRKNKQVSEKRDQKHNIPSLRAQTQKIPKSIIDRRWVQISESSLSQIVDILREIERPVIMSIHHKTRRMDAQRNLNIIINKIRDRLSKLLVPPFSRESYNYEKLREKNQELESVLISNLEQISQLKKTLDHEKNLLKKEDLDFQEFSKNAQYVENSRKQFKKHDPLIIPEDDDSKFSYSQINLDENNFLSYDVSNDRSLISLEKQLRQYINSIKSDLTKTRNIIQTSQKAHSALLKILTLYDHSLLHKILIDTCI
ncbi:hypothetical protein PCANB_002189 [Pneumocystis canis]|nr:hypothetical protein PCANB_002189 [Pneumocystis canis]